MPSYLAMMTHRAIFLAIWKAILLLRDVNLASTRLHYILLMYSSHIKQSSHVELRCKLHEKLHRVSGPLSLEDGDMHNGGINVSLACRR